MQYMMLYPGNEWLCAWLDGDVNLGEQRRSCWPLRPPLCAPLAGCRERLEGAQPGALGTRPPPPSLLARRLPSQSCWA